MDDKIFDWTSQAQWNIFPHSTLLRPVGCDCGLKSNVGKLSPIKEEKYAFCENGCAALGYAPGPCTSVFQGGKCGEGIGASGEIHARRVWDRKRVVSQRDASGSTPRNPEGWL